MRSIAHPTIPIKESPMSAKSSKADAPEKLTDPTVLKQAMHRAYADVGLVRVTMPEWPDKQGKPCVLAFRQVLTVDDCNQIDLLQFRSQVKGIELELFRILAVKPDLTPFVDPNDDDWFRSGAPAIQIARAVERCGLVQKIMDQLKPDEDEEQSGED